MPDFGHQHQHGVTKNLVEGIGGLIVGAAAVLLLTRLFKKSQAAATARPAPASPEPTAGSDAPSGAQPAPRRASRRTKAAR
jgi:membrane-associated phospholipid phosphatase